ncbi:MAG: MBL fold metallo-hydrolase [Gammaproteobacteria bacterium]
MMRIFLFLFLIILSSNIYADIIKVTILGSGTPRVNIDRFSQSILIEHKNDKFLFDAGRGALLRLNQSRILPNEIENIFFTHLHSDHILGFSDILMTGWVYHRQKPLNIFGPPGTINFVDSTIKSFEEDIKVRSLPPESLNVENLKSNIEIIYDDFIYKKNGLTIETFAVKHEPFTYAFGFKIFNSKYCMVISGDTTYSEQVIEKTKNCDLLIHEIAHASEHTLEKYPKAKGVISYHTDASQVSKIINTVKPRLTILNHVLSLDGSSDEQILNEIKKNTKHKVLIAKDLMTIDLKDEIYIYKQKNL